MPRKGVVFRGTGKVCVMKKSDFIVIGCVIVCLLPFFVSDAVYSFYKTFNAEHGMIMSFLKFAILSTLGECIGLRISAGVYNRKGFGIWPRAIVWGCAGNGYQYGNDDFLKRGSGLFEDDGYGKCCYGDGGEFIVG